MSFNRQQFFSDFIDDFYAESEEHLGNIRTQLLGLQHGLSGEALIPVLDELLRSFHTLKGLSSMVGSREIEQIAHYTEEYLRHVKASGLSTSTDGMEVLIEVAESLDGALRSMRSKEPAQDVTALITRLSSLSVSEVAGSKPVTEEIAPGPANWRFQFRPSPDLAARGVNVGIVRDRLELLGRVIRVAPVVGSKGEVYFEFIVATSAEEASFGERVGDGVGWTRVDQDAPGRPQKAAVPGSLEEISQPQTIVRVEMSRLDELMRIVGELMTHRWRLVETLKPFEGHVSQYEWRKVQETTTIIERELRTLREAVMRVRMIPIGQIFERMRFVVYTLERDSDKDVRLELSGGDTDVDKLVVERMMEPLLHIVRNAVSHGIETRRERVAAGKPVQGTIRLAASTVGDDVSIDVYDDGRGIDPGAVTERGRRLGVLGPHESVDSGSLLRVLCSPGFSTREKADLASGRGIGMSVVQRTVSELGGSLSLSTEVGEGSHFHIRLPLTLAVADAFVVAVGDERFAIPQGVVEEVLRAEPASVVKAGAAELIPYRGATLPVLRLSDVFGFTQKRSDAFHVLVISRNDEFVGIAVDRVLYHREIVIRSITDPLIRIPGFSGATEVGDGKPILIVNPVALIDAGGNRSTRSA